jgi:L,D-transpeptidase catalytic domain
MEVDGGMELHGRAYVLAGRRVLVRGVVKPYVPGQVLSVRVSSPHRKPGLATARIVKGGAFKVVFRARRAVAYKVTARHARTDQQVAFSARAIVKAISANGAGPGSHGVGVALLKQGLRRVGYPAGSGPYWTGKLGREVMAFRKVNGMARTFTASRSVFAMVFAGKGSFRLRHPKAGKHAEFDWSRQVLALYDGKTLRVYHASSGKPSTPTVFGTFHFYSKAPGTNAKGMFMSNYFIRGYAVHGYPDVPTYPASHGCIRVPNPDAIEIWNQISLGEPIYVYV